MQKLTVNEIYRRITEDPLGMEKTYIILGHVGPTGKTWLRDKLNDDGFRAFELSEDIYNEVIYSTLNNLYIENDRQKTVIIILNSPLPEELYRKGMKKYASEEATDDAD